MYQIIIQEEIAGVVVNHVEGVSPHCHQPKKTSHPQNENFIFP